MLRSRPLWRKPAVAELGLAAAAARTWQPPLLFSAAQQANFASNAPQAGGEGPLEYYIAAKLALKRIFLGETAATSAEEKEKAPRAVAVAVPSQEELTAPLAQKAAEPHATPLPDPESPKGLDWSDEAAYRRTLGPLGQANYTEMQQAGTTLSGDLSQPTGPESTANVNVLKDALDDITGSTAPHDAESKLD